MIYSGLHTSVTCKRDVRHNLWSKKSKLTLGNVMPYFWWNWKGIMHDELLLACKAIALDLSCQQLTSHWQNRLKN